MSQAYYQATISSFLNTNNAEIVGHLNLKGVEFYRQHTITTTSWNESISILKTSLGKILSSNAEAKTWHIFFEYEIPRLQKRIDVTLIAEDLIFVIEFKLDRAKFESADIRQVEDYALDLFDFHLESRDKTLVPILLAPLSKSFPNTDIRLSQNKVKNCLRSNSDDLASVIEDAYEKLHDPDAQIIVASKWENSEYRPTPTIIHAAKALFAGQRVEAISKSGADATNLTETTQYIKDVIAKTKTNQSKTICFVTGVPGAGKTLVGLNLVHEDINPQETDSDTAYFSGNGPLINVLREALARDKHKRDEELYKLDANLERPKKGEAERKIKTKIQNLHSFIKQSIRAKIPPPERVVIFDEAQRCWTAQQFFNKSKQNQNRETNPFEIQLKSEPELLLECMERHEGWSVIVALIGNGQEINTGEAGIAEWGRVLHEKYFNWQVHISPDLLSGNSSVSGQLLFESIPSNITIYEDSSLHLNTSQRSFRASHLNAWVNAVIANDDTTAFSLFKLIKEDYPIYLTRNLTKAKDWLKTKILGTKRIGFIASSGALRLRPLGINVRGEIDEAQWFLNDETDVRSSYYLEVIGTEYKVQGLELDWVGVCWDADLRRTRGNWDFKNFSGTKWQNISSQQDHQYLMNTYRVLLTRAREGMIIFVPEGDDTDVTRLPEFYDPIYEYLLSCGITEI